MAACNPYSVLARWPAGVTWFRRIPCLRPRACWPSWRSAAAIQAFSRAYPQRPLIVVLTGTDAYRFIHSDAETTLASLAAADRIVGLHGLIADCVPDTQRNKVRVIYQSARPLGGRRPPRRFFRICVAGHLRDEKDSLRAALAVARTLRPALAVAVHS